MRQEIKELIKQSIETKERLLAYVDDIDQAGSTIIHALKNNKKILIAGNGGSAADAQHFAAELMCRFQTERRGLPCVALTTDASIVTAWTNDYAVETLFARQIQALGNDGDIFIGISTSGNSKNIVNAVQAAQQKGMRTILWLGEGGKLATADAIKIQVPSSNTARIQECHVLILHALCTMIDAAFLERPSI